MRIARASKEVSLAAGARAANGATWWHEATGAGAGAVTSAVAADTSSDPWPAKEEARSRKKASDPKPSNSAESIVSLPSPHSSDSSPCTGVVAWLSLVKVLSAGEPAVAGAGADGHHQLSKLSPNACEGSSGFLHPAPSKAGCVFAACCCAWAAGAPARPGAGRGLSTQRHMVAAKFATGHLPLCVPACRLGGARGVSGNSWPLS
mmetsp:Transcript_12327/g.30942  ORF Transcript_12327/g.30942 Transcript_12327/m.30942 type:complete len:205 (-) Transcript_12327:144-758(-)